MREVIILASIVVAMLAIGAVVAAYASWLLLSVAFVVVLNQIKKESNERGIKKSNKED
jgi:hypothetical protein